MMNDDGIGVTGNISFQEKEVKEHMGVHFFLERVSNLQNLNSVIFVSRSENRYIYDTWGILKLTSWPSGMINLP